MGVIHVLPEAIANKIAAGEVIERPSSIVKELIENSLDAGAKSLEIEVNHGGRSLIRVNDDGAGMTPEDAELAFKRHATSKITSDEDLDAIASFGFRGEALPSISAVARVKMTTRPAGNAAGIEINVEGGRITAAKECPCGPGTTVEVRDLFFNTPARRKFLRTDSTELGHVMDVITHFALARPEVRFVFISAGKRNLDFMPAVSLETRAREVLGEDLMKHMIPFEEKVEGITACGLMGKPFAARGNRSGQMFFINGRWIRSIGLSHALQAGYHGLLMHGQYPAAVVFLELDLDRVDVNVHPTKQEVRISKEAEVKSLLKKAIAGRLRECGDISPELRPFADLPGDAAPYTGFAPVLPKQDAVSLYAAELARETYSPSEESDEEMNPLEFSAPLKESVFYRGEARESELLEIRNRFKITKILGQVHGTFILAETEEGFMIIDQHAAHERVMFEVLLRNFQAGQAVRQSLLMGEILELHPKQVEIFRNSLELLRKIGFELDEFGENSFILRAYPAVLERENPVEFLKRFLEEREDGKLSTRLEAHHEEIAALIACKRQSVKAHDTLSPLQISALLERLALCENPFSCPHGRPTFFRKTFLELEKQFKRK